MKQTEPWYTCDNCGRELMKRFVPQFLKESDSEMHKYRTHFCNNNCTEVYLKNGNRLPKKYFVSADWPTKASVR